VRRLAVAAAVLAVLALATCGGGEEKKTGRQKLDVQIGDLLPMTGHLDEFGKAARRASDVAAEEIRKAAAKAGAQHKVTVNQVDYKSEPLEANAIATKLADEGADCLVGPWGPGHASRTGAKVSTPEQILQITPSASAEQLSEVKDEGYLNRVVPPDRLQATALAELIERELKGARGKKVNIGALESTYGKVLTDSFEAVWRDKRGSIGAKVTYRADQSTLSPQAKQLAAGKPDAWVFFDFAETFARIGQELLQNPKAGWSPRKTFGTDSLANARLPLIGPTVSNGLRGVAISAPRTGEAAEQFDQRFKQSGGVTRQTFDAQEFDAIVLCYLSAVAAGSTSGEVMKDELRAITAAPGRKYTWLQLDQAIKALEAGQDIDYEGVSGSIELNGRGDPTAGVYDVYRYEPGKLTLADQIAVPRGTGGV
jgi:ABC-type branched-subunit amino acid transport system substrate-binding protein